MKTRRKSIKKKKKSRTSRTTEQTSSRISFRIARANAPVSSACASCATAVPLRSDSSRAGVRDPRDGARVSLSIRVIVRLPVIDDRALAYLYTTTNNNNYYYFEKTIARTGYFRPYTRFLWTAQASGCCFHLVSYCNATRPPVRRNAQSETSSRSFIVVFFVLFFKVIKRFRNVARAFRFPYAYTPACCRHRYCTRLYNSLLRHMHV